MSQPVFAADFTIPHPHVGEMILHVRGDTATEFNANLAAARAAFGRFIGYWLNPADYEADGLPKNSNTVARRIADGRLPVPISQAEPTPVCPEHGISKPSKFTGFYCPNSDGGAFCKWTHGQKKQRRAG